MERKIKAPSALVRILRAAHAKNKRIVFTNGCFDILHAGHVEYLKRARRLGDMLVVGLNSDASVRRLKGRTRPINNQRDRARVLAALSFINYVTIFDEDTPLELIKILKPDVLVKGADWKASEIVGGDFVKAHGGRVATVPFVKGYSTTSLLKRLSR